ncbi:methylamine utilization protein [Methylobacterium sp. J-070]|uniref:methylamine utilization protein n=1 Tax=Methylobacterium sp. J-070 TaxID=2836650 RepID=UPI001FB973CD|nr:methylamine utilization protein [Methylobacterium sp. J-070]MCJ2048368.1 methylamine utilization protein [Methylobacterium sp. J-070]
MLNNNRKFLTMILLGTAVSLAVVSGAIASLPDSDHVISQKGKQFGPRDVFLRSGEHVTIVNDDANFVHHAYVESEAFAFDSGDIEPGAKAVITFPKEGDFIVLCGIHPKMKLAVHVE